MNEADMSGADELTNMDFDPQPNHLRNNVSYTDYFRNTCLNFPGILQMPIFQTFEPANTRAVALDHDYLKSTLEDNILEKILVTSITDKNIVETEKRTVGQINNKEWKDERRKHLTSSMFGTICKATERIDKIKLAKSLLAQDNDFTTHSLEHGQKR